MISMLLQFSNAFFGRIFFGWKFFFVVEFQLRSTLFLKIETNDTERVWIKIECNARSILNGYTISNDDVDSFSIFHQTTLKAPKNTNNELKVLQFEIGHEIAVVPKKNLKRYINESLRCIWNSSIRSSLVSFWCSLVAAVCFIRCVCFEVTYNR